MEAPNPAALKEIEKKDEMLKDLKKEFQQILINNLDGREYKEEKLKVWVNNILSGAKEYFANKYSDYSIFLYSFICEKYFSFRNNFIYISTPKYDAADFVVFRTDNLFATLHFFFYKNCDLTYSIDELESEIIKKGNELLIKYLDERKFVYEKLDGYNDVINKEHINFILQKETRIMKCYAVNRIIRNPIGKYYFKYLSHGKQICSKIFQTYTNDSLTCYHELFFFK